MEVDQPYMWGGPAAYGGWGAYNGYNNFGEAAAFQPQQHNAPGTGKKKKKKNNQNNQQQQTPAQARLSYAAAAGGSKGGAAEKPKIETAAPLSSEDWPPALKSYVSRCFEQCKSDMDKDQVINYRSV